MGVYLNSTSAYGLFRRDYESAYFVDKSSILAQLVPLVETDESRIEKSSLNQEKGYVSIPNKELMDKFAEVVQREPSLGNVHKPTV